MVAFRLEFSLLALFCVDYVSGSLISSFDATTFGHSIKNGPLAANTEITTFEHACKMPPCVVTQLHIPSIYNPAGQPRNWENGLLRIYIDGSTTPIQLKLVELAAVGQYGAVGADTPTDGSPYGIGLFGKTANNGGVYSTVRIPFYKSIKTTIEAAPGTIGQSIFWFIIRGLEATEVRLGDLTLPTGAKLSIHRNDNITVDRMKLFTLAEVPPGMGGAHLLTQVDAKSDVPPGGGGARGRPLRLPRRLHENPPRDFNATGHLSLSSSPPVRRITSSPPHTLMKVSGPDPQTYNPPTV